MWYIVSTDVGGTFVDAVILSPDGSMAIGKAPSTPRDPARGVLAAVEAAAQHRGVPVQEILSRCRLFLNGTTVTTNAMIQRRGARTGLLITRGFEDTLIIGRVMSRTVGLSEAQLMDYPRAERPEPVVPIELTRGVWERVDYAGRVVRPIDLARAEMAVDELVAAGIEALAICLLWSFRNPAHERALADLVRHKYPHLYVSVSSELAPLIREYERANTTAINAYVGPVLDHYLTHVESGLRELGYRHSVLVMQSIGGLCPAQEVRQVAVTTLLSGPVGGVIGAMKLGELVGDRNLITTDMGGTSFDVGLIVDGRPQVSGTTVIERNVIMLPAVDVVTIGAGGGSVAWLDAAGLLRVGPHSQGADPGPACYGRGGDLPTVTDADVVLGYINPENFLGGQMRLSEARAREAIRRHVAEPLGLTVEQAARGIYDIVNAHMADLIRKVTVERGHDPRHFTLVAYGGCGPVHCCGYAKEIGIKRIIVPSAQTVFSALGIALSDIRHFFWRSCPVRIPRSLAAAPEELAALEATRRELLAAARRQLAQDGVPEEAMAFAASVDMRYRDQVHEIQVPLPAEPLTETGALRSLVTLFQQQYEQLYGRGSASELADMEILNVRIDCWAPPVVRPTIREVPYQGPSPERAYLRHRPVYWPELGGYVPTPTFQGEALLPGNEVIGPAVVEMYGTTVPIPPDWRLAVDRWLNFILAPSA
jgi:N-methylhydantoinase A